MLVKRERIERVCHGVYRAPQVAPTGFDRFMLALLWTGAEEAALSHETALDSYGVCDVNPTKIHVTVKQARRIRRNGGQGYSIHYQDLVKPQVGWWEGILCVKLATAIEQSLDTGTQAYLLNQAIKNGRKRGLITSREERDLIAKVRKKNGE